MGFRLASEGDLDGLAMKVRPSFTINDIAALPEGAHILMLNIDQESGQLRAIEGFEIDEEWIADALQQHADDPRDVPFSAVMIEVSPLTPWEEQGIALAVMARHQVHEPKNEREEEARKHLQKMLVDAARLGRGLSG